MKNTEKETDDYGEYVVWLREERHSEYRIPKSEIGSLEEAKDLVRTQVEKSADFFVDDYIETWGESTCQLTDCLRDDPSDEIFDAYEEE